MNPQSDLMRVAAGCLLGALLGFAVLGQRSVVALDYRAFYCAGAALRNHEDPYRTVSLRDCELNRTDSQYRSRLPSTTLPAPQPLYDIAFFSLFSGLPFAVAKAVWGAVIGAALFATLYSLVRLTGWSPPLVFAVLGTALIGSTLALGQIIPIYTAAACACALLLGNGRPRAAGAVAVVSMIEPHLGLPLCASVFLWSRESRVPLLVGGAVLALTAFAAGGWAVNVEYASVVLPLHALSELSSDGQLSLSVILHALHVSDAAAIRIGTLSYLAMCALGVWGARALALRFVDNAYLATTAAAAAVAGGSFLHGTDVIAAVPLAMMLANVPQFRSAAVGAVVLLATPWAAQSQPHDMIGWFAFAAATTAYVLWSIAKLRLSACIGCAAMIFTVLCQVNFAYERDQRVYERHPHAAAVAIDERYPQAGWARVNAGTFATQSAPAWLMRAPTWGGILLLSGITGAAATRRVKLAFA